MSTIKSDLHIEGMSCRHCIDAVEGALGALPTVAVEEVAIGRARITYDPHEVNPDDLHDAVEEAGYEVQSTDQIA